MSEYEQRSRLADHAVPLFGEADALAEIIRSASETDPNSAVSLDSLIRARASELRPALKRGLKGTYGPPCEPSKTKILNGHVEGIGKVPTQLRQPVCDVAKEIKTDEIATCMLVRELRWRKGNIINPGSKSISSGHVDDLKGLLAEERSALLECALCISSWHLSRVQNATTTEQAGISGDMVEEVFNAFFEDLVDSVDGVGNALESGSQMWEQTQLLDLCGMLSEASRNTESKVGMHHRLTDALDKPSSRRPSGVLNCSLLACFATSLLPLSSLIRQALCPNEVGKSDNEIDSKETLMKDDENIEARDEISHGLALVRATCSQLLSVVASHECNYEMVAQTCIDRGGLDFVMRVADSLSSRSVQSLLCAPTLHRSRMMLVASGLLVGFNTFPGETSADVSSSVSFLARRAIAGDLAMCTRILEGENSEDGPVRALIAAHFERFPAEVELLVSFLSDIAVASPDCAFEVARQMATLSSLAFPFALFKLSIEGGRRKIVQLNNTVGEGTNSIDEVLEDDVVISTDPPMHLHRGAQLKSVLGTDGETLIHVQTFADGMHILAAALLKRNRGANDLQAIMRFLTESFGASVGLARHMTLSTPFEGPSNAIDGALNIIMATSMDESKQTAFESKREALRLIARLVDIGALKVESCLCLFTSGPLKIQNAPPGKLCELSHQRRRTDSMPGVVQGGDFDMHCDVFRLLSALIRRDIGIANGRVLAAIVTHLLSIPLYIQKNYIPKKPNSQRDIGQDDPNFIYEFAICCKNALDASGATLASLMADDDALMEMLIGNIQIRARRAMNTNLSLMQNDDSSSLLPIIELLSSTLSLLQPKFKLKYSLNILRRLESDGLETVMCLVPLMDLKANLGLEIVSKAFQVCKYALQLGVTLSASIHGVFTQRASVELVGKRLKKRICSISHTDPSEGESSKAMLDETLQCVETLIERDVLAAHALLSGNEEAGKDEKEEGLAETMREILQSDDESRPWKRWRHLRIICKSLSSVDFIAELFDGNSGGVDLEALLSRLALSLQGALSNVQSKIQDEHAMDISSDTLAASNALSSLSLLTHRRYLRNDCEMQSIHSLVDKLHGPCASGSEKVSELMRLGSRLTERACRLLSNSDLEARDAMGASVLRFAFHRETFHFGGGSANINSAANEVLTSVKEFVPFEDSSQSIHSTLRNCASIMQGSQQTEGRRLASGGASFEQMCRAREEGAAIVRGSNGDTVATMRLLNGIKEIVHADGFALQRMNASTIDVSCLSRSLPGLRDSIDMGAISASESESANALISAAGTFKLKQREKENAAEELVASSELWNATRLLLVALMKGGGRENVHEGSLIEEGSFEQWVQAATSALYSVDLRLKSMHSPSAQPTIECALACLTLAGRAKEASSDAKARTDVSQLAARIGRLIVKLKSQAGDAGEDAPRALARLFTCVAKITSFHQIEEKAQGDIVEALARESALDALVDSATCLGMCTNREMGEHSPGGTARRAACVACTSISRTRVGAKMVSETRSAERMVHRLSSSEEPEAMDLNVLSAVSFGTEKAEIAERIAPRMIDFIESGIMEEGAELGRGLESSALEFSLNDALLSVASMVLKHSSSSHRLKQLVTRFAGQHVSSLHGSIVNPTERIKPASALVLVGSLVEQAGTEMMMHCPYAQSKLLGAAADAVRKGGLPHSSLLAGAWALSRPTAWPESCGMKPSELVELLNSNCGGSGGKVGEQAGRISDLLLRRHSV